MTEEFIIEKLNRRTWIQRILHTICLLFPIASCFAGYYAAPFLYNKCTSFNLFKKLDIEVFKFFTIIVFFAVSSLIVFVKTRNTNPIIKIRVLNKKK